MKQIVQTVTKEVTKQSNPEPMFVSIVNRGANQTPFKVIKCEIDMAKKDDSPVLQQMVFSKKSFNDAESVQTYISEKGYEIGDSEITDNDDNFSVIASEENLFESTEKIEDKEAGVTRVVGVLKAEEPEKTEEQEEEPEKTEPEEPETEEAEKSEIKTDEFKALSKKYDSYDARYSDKMSLSEVLKDGASWSAAFPAFVEVHQAHGIAVMNAVISGDVAEIKQINADFSKMITALAKIFADLYKEDAEKAELVMSGKTSTEKSDEIKPEIDDEVLKSIQEAITGLSEGMQTLTEKSESFDKFISDQKETATKSAEEKTDFNEKFEALKSTVEQLADAPQLPRGDESPETLEVDHVSKADQEFQDKMAANTLGLSVS